MSIHWTPDRDQGSESTLQAVSRFLSTPPGFVNFLPGDQELAQIEDVANSIPSDHEILLLGIGGSALGSLALVDALCPEAGHRLTVIDNIDPDSLSRLLESVDLTATTILVISKSGGTAETSSQLLWIIEKLRQRGIDPDASIVAITDPEKGTRRSSGQHRGWRTLPVPPEVGGRFSVLTAVGLLPAALTGIDIHALVAGARSALSDLSSATADHALVRWISSWEEHHELRTMVVHFAYRDRLVTLGDWFAQLWAESLGKKHDLSGREVYRGSTPLVARGVTDQHSLVQLFVEGPDDKQFLFLDAHLNESDLEISKETAQLHPDLEYLGNKSLGELRRAELEGTIAALQSAGRPVSRVLLDTIDESHIGAWMMLMEIATVLAAEILNVDPFDQPGVEGGKAVAFARMGKPGWSEKGRRIEAGAQELKPSPPIPVSKNND